MSNHSLVGHLKDLRKKQVESSGRPARTNWVFLGPNGVGKGTYAKRVAKLMGVPHISTGDLVREKIKTNAEFSAQVKEITHAGKLISDEMIMSLLIQRFKRGAALGEQGFILDGFPRTLPQAVALAKVTDVHLVVNMDACDEVLVQKCAGRRTCSECGKGYNVADVFVSAGPDRAEPIVMPPMPPPKKCSHKMVTRPDDAEAIVKRRLDSFRIQCEPVQEYYRAAGVLMDYEIHGGFEVTLPEILDTLHEAMVQMEPADDEECPLASHNSVPKVAASV